MQCSRAQLTDNLTCSVFHTLFSRDDDTLTQEDTGKLKNTTLVSSAMGWSKLVGPFLKESLLQMSQLVSPLLSGEDRSANIDAFYAKSG